MAEFAYVARERSGGRVEGLLTASSERDVMALLDEKGLLPIAIRAHAPAPLRLPKRRRRVGGRIMARTYRQLSDLLRSGVPLLRSLELLERQSGEPTLAAALVDVRKAVADGEGLAESMGKHPLVFAELAVSMVRAGQEGGFLEDVLSRIADYTEQEEELKGKVLGAMAYPIFLFVIGVTVITVLIVFFVPKFEQIFGRLRAKGQLPALTIGLLETSRFLQTYGLALLALAAVALAILRHAIRTPAGREKLDLYKLKAPALGAVLKNLAIVRFSRVLGTLLANGIPILAALRIAKDSTGNIILARTISRAADNVTTGESLTAPLRASGVFPTDVVEMVSIAEESNTLEKVLLDIADSLEKRTTRQLELVVRLLEPMMLLVMAAVTLVVVAALLLPIMRMSSALK